MEPELSPRSAPLTYPGRFPASSVVFDGEVERHVTGLADVDRLLAAHDTPLMARRRPVLAVGSNACTAQLREKFEAAGVNPVVPLTRCTVSGVRVGLIPLVTRYGYIPSAPVFEPGHQSHLFVVWFDDEQLRAVDATELGPYARSELGAEVTVALDGVRLDRVDAYTSALGVLSLDRWPDGIASQTQLIERVLQQFHWRGRLLDVRTAGEWVAHFRADVGARAAFAVDCERLGLVDGVTAPAQA